MLPDVIVSLPRNVQLPQYRLFQRVRFHVGLEDEEETATGLVVGWWFITRDQIEDNSRAGYFPRWQYIIQLDPGCSYGTAGNLESVDESEVVEIVEP